MKTIVISLFLILGCVLSAAQSIITYTYDKQGRMKSEKIENAYEMLYNYDKEGNLIYKMVTNNTSLDQELFGDNECVIYPNPTREKVTVEILTTNSDYEISLCDISGKMLEKQNFRVSKVQLSLEKYVCGVYFLILKSGNKTTRYKLVKI